MSVEAVSGSVSAVGIKETPTPTVTASLQFLPAPGCEQPRQAGPCDNLSPRWFFDSKYGVCKEFAFGGCLVSSSNFLYNVGVMWHDIPCTGTCTAYFFKANGRLGRGTRCCLQSTVLKAGFFKSNNSLK